MLYNTYTADEVEIVILKKKKLTRIKDVECAQIALSIIIIYSRLLTSPYYQVSTSNSCTSAVKCNTSDP